MTISYFESRMNRVNFDTICVAGKTDNTQIFILQRYESEALASSFQ